ncbi:MAG: excinuclease ABC subunit B [Candidatus Sungbacteria bacterium RIFCSPHIGHO2_01_FULL_50_25]|uniref:UvrABC system protein B n=1 Tax=Candidatus Sungbacteria bacterium RIFCSPHIGHO2_01_FULL_50_25 TaxID=1802265 RepID=A0A1G2K8X3_9BACT|nr:MAG: excinuclease ABC subunit B [Candidatus Sungbacteria bacterium RIFCSPHIGHO2_01_FULL_50_25]
MIKKSNFILKAPFSPTGDQPAAIDMLTKNIDAGVKRQTLLGVTGSGKTFTMANVIARTGLPTLVISHNKTLAAQLYQEFKEFFPESAVHYFVSYYDYYQPEAYIPQSDTYIEKDAKINEVIDSLRHASTASLLSRPDVVIVASVSCIYGIGGPEEYQHAALDIQTGARMSQKSLVAALTALQYTRNPIDPRQGHFRVRENTVEIRLPTAEDIVRVEIEKGSVQSIKIEKTDFKKKNAGRDAARFKIFPAKHFVTPHDTFDLAMKNIETELALRLAEFKKNGKVLEAQRLRERTEFDLATLRSTGFVNGIENYSRQLSFREPGSPPHTLIDYFRYAHGENFLTVIDESHATIPQIRGMHAGDASRKKTLIDYGFRLPSALDNRPLTFAEFDKKISSVVYASATPAPYEIQESGAHVVQQLIRPTGILDPKIEIRPTKNQIRDVIKEIRGRAKKGERSLVMALTKRLAEDIAEYLTEAGIKAEYLHSEIKTFERTETLKKLREGTHDVIVGINLLREGLDLPEVSFIAILDADKEGFLRNETTLLQIIGRAARHIDGKVILYADTVTGSMKAAIRETERRQNIQAQYNKAHNITPKEIKKEIRKSLREEILAEEDALPEGNAKQIIKELRRQMKKAAKEFNFELAARIRDKIRKFST